MPTSIDYPSNATPPRNQIADDRRARHRKILAAALILIVLAAGTALAVNRSSPRNAAVATPATATSVTPAAVSITIDNFAFNPASLIVKAGTTVVWTNLDADVHTVRTTASPTLKSDPLDTNATFSYHFETAGAYAYHCSIHPEMHGTVVVTK